VCILSGRQGEPFGRSLTDVENELGVLPHLVLTTVDVERASANGSKPDISITDHQLAILETQRKTAVTATPGLEQHDWPPLGDQVLECVDCYLGGNHPR
jgi:hypothetical protein